jgi:hypothetical protein
MRAMRTMIWLTAVAVLAAAAFGCAEQRPERSYVQPNAILKSTFSGTWYYKSTVIDHPYENKFTVYIGWESGVIALEKIRWVIDENFLYAYRTTEAVLQTEPGKCAAAGTTEYDTTIPQCFQDNDCQPGQVCIKQPESFYGAPVAAYKILSHFDIQRQYNPTTGEEINVLEENTRDRWWWEREYIRVDWSMNQVYDFFHFINELIDPMYQAMKKEPVSYFDQQNFIVTPEYIDVVNQEIISLTVDAAYMESSYPVVSNSIPVTYRHSFLKKVPSEYQPLNYPDPMFEKFGYFRLDREGYDKLFGLNEITRNYNISRWNIFKRWKDDNGNLIPTKDREIKRIVYYLSKDFPAHLRETSYSFVRDWDVAYRHAIAGMLETEGMPAAEARAWVEGKVDRAANNGWGALVFQLRDNDECDDTWQANVVDDNGQRILRSAEKCGKNIGDLRYSLINWIAKPMAGGPLGLGPSESDPETGEIINGTANIYGAALETYKQQAVLFYRIIKEQVVNGTDITDLIAKGEDMRSYFQAQYGGIHPQGPQGGPWRPAEHARSAIQNVLKKAQRFGQDGRLPLELLQDHALMTANSANMREIAEKMPDFEQMLLGRDIMVTKGFDVSEEAGGVQLTPEIIEKYSPLRKNGRYEPAENFHAHEYVKGRFGCVYESNEFTDWAVWRLVQKYTVERQITSEEEIANIIENAIYRAVTAHEVGHTIGLRHQFEATADPTHFYNEYWTMYQQVIESSLETLQAEPACAGVTTLSDFDLYSVPNRFPNADSFDQYQAKWVCFRTLMDKKGADFYQYTSIMDYAGQYYTDGFPGVENYEPWLAPKADIWAEQYPMTIGKYDIAAIKFGYGLVAEKWGASAGKYDKTQRKNFKYYYGGEDCRAQACPYSALGQTCLTGVCRPVFIQGYQAWDGGERCGRNADCPGAKDGQVCEADPSYPPICSEFYQNFDYSKDDAAEGNPVRYAMCSDERTDDQPFCNRWDEGATSQEIVANMIETYNRNYVFNNFRRYRRNFGFTYDARIFGRYFTTIGKQYQAMLYNYFYKPGMRAPSSETKPGGIIDMYFASANGLNFFNSVLSQPDIGAYVMTLDPDDKRYYRVSGNAYDALADCTVHWGEGKYYWHRYEPGYYGQLYRLAIIGSVIDKIMALDAMSTRDWNFPPTAGIRFYINYFDFFRNEVLDVFTGMMAEDPSKYAAVVSVDPDNKHCTITPRNVWYGGEGFFNQQIVPRNPATDYEGKYFLDPSGSFYNQYYAFAYATERFSVFFDASFRRQYLSMWLSRGFYVDPDDEEFQKQICLYKSPFPPYYEFVGYTAPAEVGSGAGAKTIDRSMTCAVINRANYWKGCYVNEDCPGVNKQSAYYSLQSVESFMNIMTGAYASGLD